VPCQRQTTSYPRGKRTYEDNLDDVADDNLGDPWLSKRIVPETLGSNEKTIINKKMNKKTF